MDRFNRLEHPLYVQTDAPRSKKVVFQFFLSIMLPMFIAVAEQSVIATVLPAIAASLGKVEIISWIAIAYLVAVTLSAPVYGVFGDTFGKRRTLFIALGIYCAGSICCGLSTSTEMLIAARAMQGIGAGGLMTSSQALIGDFIPARERGYYQGYLSTIVMIGTTAGPLIGALLTETFGWRSIFVGSVIVSLAAMFLASRLPLVPILEKKRWRLDYVGIVLFIVFVVSFLIGLTLIKWPMPDFAILASAFSLAAVSLMALIAWERRAIVPFIPLKFLRQPAMWRTNALAMFHGATMVSFITMLPIFLRVGSGISVSRSAMLLAVMSIGSALGSIATGWLVSRTGRTYVYPASGMAIAAITFLYMAAFPTASFAFMISALGVIGTCLGTTMAVVQITAQHIAGPSAYGLAAGFAQFSRSIGAAIGIAFVTTVFFVILSAESTSAMASFGALLADEPEELLLGSSAEIAEEAKAIQAAISGSFILIGIFSTLASLVSWNNPVQRI